MRLTHEDIWHAIEAIANSREITLSGLAKLCGRDSTAFNKSKWFDRNGKPHWMCTSTLAGILEALDMSWIEFADYLPNGGD